MLSLATLEVLEDFCIKWDHKSRRYLLSQLLMRVKVTCETEKVPGRHSIAPVL